MKNKTQIQRFMDYEIAIRVKDEKEFRELMTEIKKADKNIDLFKTYNDEYYAYKRHSRNTLARDVVGGIYIYNTTVEDFNPTQPQPRILVNNNTTIVWFEDGQKVVVKHTDDTEFDLEKAVAMACAKKLLGGYTEFKKLLDVVEYKNKPKYAILKSRGELYSTYLDFFTKHGFEKYKEKYVVAKGCIYRGSELPNIDAMVKILDTREDIYVIQPVGTNKIYLIHSNGLEFL